MLRTRVIPCLLIKERGLVKTIKFSKPNYIGDPINAVKIFNEKEVDELVFLDITATNENRKPHFDLISEIASECFMPFGYGGGIKTIEDVKKLFQIGSEKAIINSQAYKDPNFIKECANLFGSQSIVVSMDIKKNFLGKYNVYINSGTYNTQLDPIKYAQQMESLGAGELFINSIDKDGMMNGYDIELINKISSSVNIPVIACGGAGKLEDFGLAINKGKASAVSAGSMFVYYGKYKAVLINYPKQVELETIFNGINS